MVGIIIVTYNNERLFLPQAECIEKFCLDDHQIVVVDNSTNEKSATAIKYYCQEIKAEYIKVKASSENGSESHAFAANLAYIKYKSQHSSLFFLDHDCFPIKQFSVKDILGENVLAGISQGKSVIYLWPGCLMMNTQALGSEEVDFSVNHTLGLDTGGNLHKVMEGKMVRFLDETYIQNPEISPPHSFHALIHQGTFMHMINGSNWNNGEGHQERTGATINMIKRTVG